MADLSYDSFQKQNKSKSKNVDLSYDSFTASQQPKTKQTAPTGPKTEKNNNILQQAFVNTIGRAGDYTGRVLGLAVAGGAKLLGKDDAARRITDAALDQTPVKVPVIGARVDAQKPLGQGGGAQILKNTGKTALDIASLGYGSAGNAALKTAATKAGLGKVGSTVAANAVEGVAYNTATNVLNDRKAMENTGVAAAASVILPAVLNKLLKSKTVTKEVIDAVDQIEESIPVAVQASKKLSPLERLKIYSKQQGYEPYKASNELPVIDMGGKPKGSVELPTIQTGSVAKQTKPIKGDVTFETINPETNMPFSRADKLPKQTDIPTSNITQQIDLPIQAKPAPKTIKNEPISFQNQTNEVQQSTVLNDFELDPQKVEDIALGKRIDTTNNVPADAYFAFMKNKADETLDLNLIEKLKNSKVASVSAQKLQANKLAKENNIVDIVKDIESELLKRKGSNVKTIEKESVDAVKKINSTLQEISQSVPSRETIIRALEAIKCK